MLVSFIEQTEEGKEVKLKKRSDKLCKYILISVRLQRGCVDIFFPTVNSVDHIVHGIAESDKTEQLSLSLFLQPFTGESGQDSSRELNQKYFNFSLKQGR